MGKGLLYLNFPMVKYMQFRTGICDFAIIFCVLLLILVPAAYAGCGIDTNPYDDDPGPLPNGYFPPAPDFSGDPVQGYAPLAVSFTDKSTNVPTNWAWNFGDGYSSNVKNPVHTYQSPGVYTVTLTAGNRYGGNSITKASYIIVNPVSSAPVVDFSANITTGYLPLVVELSDLSIGGTIKSRTWTFGHNGFVVTEHTPNQKILHTFTEPGRFNVTLTVTAENNESALLEKAYYISVTEPAPEQGTIVLHPGWNLVSPPVPLKEQYHTAAQVFADVDTDSRSIYSYDAGSNQFVPLTSQSVILPLEGIWVYSKYEIPLTFEYQTSRPVTVLLHLPSGWNLIGYPSNGPGSARDGYGPINTIWATILCFDSATQQYSTTIFNEGAGGQGDQQLMQPMNGYWIFMPHDGDLIVSIE
jgi:PKD repeat protein